MKRSIDRWKIAARGPLLACVALLSLGGCDPVPEWNLVFRGEVRRADTGAPVPGAQVEIRVAHPDEPSFGAPTVRGQTDAAGRFDARRGLRSRGTPQSVTLHVIPPAGSGLASRTVGGEARDVFIRIAQSDETITFDAEITLTP